MEYCIGFSRRGKRELKGLPSQSLSFPWSSRINHRRFELMFPQLISHCLRNDLFQHRVAEPPLSLWSEAEEARPVLYAATFNSVFLNSASALQIPPLNLGITLSFPDTALAFRILPNFGGSAFKSC